MENKKDIGKAFREKLDSLEKQPDNAVWNAIKADLPKKKRRFLPLFWAGASTTVKTVVVTLSLMFATITGYLFKDYNTAQSKQNNYQENTNNIVVPAENLPDAKNSIHPDKNGNTGATKNITDEDILKPVSGNESNKTDKHSSGNKTISTTKLTIKQNQNKNSNKRVLNNTVSEANSRGDAENNTVHTINSTHKKVVTVSKNKKRNIRKNIKNSSVITSGNLAKNKQAGSGNSNDSGNNTGIAGEKKVNDRSFAKNSDPVSNNNTNDRRENIKDLEDTASDNNSANDLSSETDAKLTDTALQSVDSLSVLEAKDSTAICKDIVEENITKSDSAATASFKRFYIFAHVSPTQYVLNNALLPDATLSANKTTTKISFNYGVFMGYNFNQKWSMRTGIALTGSEHTTQNALLKSTYSVVPGNPGTGTNPNGYVHLMPPANYTGINYTRNGSNVAAIQHLGQANEAVVDIIQKIEFAEVPLEITYNLHDSKFGIGIIAGISTLFTTKNIVYTQNSRGTMWLGTNKNVKNIGFSGTVGFHFSYKPLPYLQFNAEPVFKYYLNTFSNSVPYSFGLQAGLQYNFNLFATKK